MCPDCAKSDSQCGRSPIAKTQGPSRDPIPPLKFLGLHTYATIAKSGLPNKIIDNLRFSIKKNIENIDVLMDHVYLTS